MKTIRFILILLFSIFYLNVISQKPVAHYTFDDSTATDFSGNGLNGIIYNVDPTDGADCSTAAWFNGNYSSIIFEEAFDSLFGTNTYSFSVWVKPLSYQENYNISTNAPDRFRIIMGRWQDINNIGNGFILTTGRFSSNTKDLDFKNVPLNVWSHLAVCADSGDVCIYVNGELVAHDTGFYQVNDGGNFSIGGIRESSIFGGNAEKFLKSAVNPDEPVATIDYANSFHGSIDDVRIYDTVLTQKQINDIRKENIFYDQYHQDTAIASSMPVSFGPNLNNKFQYRWNTGETTSQISAYSDESITKVYSLEIKADETCRIKDTIVISWYSQFDNLVARWTFNDSSSIVSDVDEILNAVVDTGVMCSKSFYYNGINATIALGDTLNDVFTNSNFTISFWVFLMDTLDANNDKSTLINKWYTSTKPDNAFFCYYNSIVFNNAYIFRKIDFRTPELYKWHNYVIIKESNLEKIYIDGKLEGTCYNAQLSPTKFSLRLGGLWNNHYFLKGRIDELKIFNRALFVEEIQQLYREGGVQKLGNLTDTEVYSNNSLTLNAGIGFDEYIWYDGSSDQTKTISNITNAMEDISVLAINNDGCFTDTISVSIKTDFYKNTDKIECTIKIWPCPAKNEINISFDSNLPEKISIVNIHGVSMKSIDINNELQTIDITDLNPGIYLLKLHYMNKTITKNIIIQ